MYWGFALTTCDLLALPNHTPKYGASNRGYISQSHWISHQKSSLPGKKWRRVSATSQFHRNSYSYTLGSITISASDKGQPEDGDFIAIQSAGLRVSCRGLTSRPFVGADSDAGATRRGTSGGRRL
jgi:hypothetical protein